MRRERAVIRFDESDNEVNENKANLAGFTKLGEAYVLNN